MLALNYRTILGVALPMMVTGFIQSIVLLTDASLIARYSTAAFDAVGNAGLLYVTLYMCLAGMADGAQIIIARRIGQDRPDLIGQVFGTTVWVLMGLAMLLFMVLYWVMPDLVYTYSAQKEIAHLQGIYIEQRSFSLFFAMITLAIQSFFLAEGKSWVVLVTSLLTASSNALLAYLLIFGKWGLPELGIQGAAMASMIADGIGMLSMLGFLWFSKERKNYQLLSYFKLHLGSLKELLKVGSPLLLQGFSALATWTLFFTWLEQKGTFDLTVSQNIRSIYFLAFVPIWGFAGTTKTYISQYLGAKKYDQIPLIQRRIQLLTISFMLLTFHGAVLYPEAMIRMVNPAEAYVSKSADILRLIAVSILVFGFISVYFQTIHGSGNTIHSMLIEFFTVGVYAIFCYLFIKVWNLDIFWIWTVEYIYFGLLGLISILYLKNFAWQKKQV
ncbi:MAG: MATE family efflux transporter [Flavobacteriales bacterium]